MKRTNIYTTLKHEAFSLADFDAEERAIVDELIEKQMIESNWPNFRNYYTSRVGDFYLARGLSRLAITRTPLWRIAQDLSGRILVRLGHATPPDYRDELDELIREKFPNRRSFCEATGISEDMLSHVLARRKHLATDTLSEALNRIGYRLHIEPFADCTP